MKDSLKRKLPPIFLGLGVIALDQASKAAVVSASHNLIGMIANPFGDFLYIVHQRNLGAAFSLADGLPGPARAIVLSALPLAVLALALAYYFRTKELSRLQEWALLSIVGGGLGNIMDRIFRPLGVVDFISVKFYGLFGLDRWPTFNVADSAVVIGSVLIAVSFLAQGLAAKKPKEARQ